MDEETHIKEPTMWWWRQRLDLCYHRPTNSRIAGAHQKLGNRYGTHSTSEPIQKESTVKIPWVWTTWLQKCKRMNFCFLFCFVFRFLKPLSLWQFVTMAIENQDSCWEAIMCNSVLIIVSVLPITCSCILNTRAMEIWTSLGLDFVSVVQKRKVRGKLIADICKVVSVMLGI